MPIVIGQHAGPIELLPQKQPTASAEGNTVALTLHVYAPDFPDSVAELRIHFAVQDATQLSTQLLSAIERAARVR